MNTANTSPKSTEEFVPSGVVHVQSDRRLSMEIHESSNAPQVMRDWKQLDERIGQGALMSCYEWTQTWLKHYGDFVPHRFVAGRCDGRVCGICLVTQGVGQKDGPIAIETRHLGTAGEPEADSVCVDYNRLLVEEPWRSEFINGVADIVLSDPDWDEFRLDGFLPDEIDPLVNQSDVFQLRERASLYFDLKSARQLSNSAISRLGNSTKKTIRKNLKAYGTLTEEWAESVEQAESIFDDLVRLHQARWNAVGEPGVYASERFLNFHRDLISKLVGTGQVVLFRVSRGDQVVGCVQLLIDRNRALCYQGGSAAYDDTSSPGLVVDYLCIEQCLRRGFDAYDFLGGDTFHKRRLSTDSNQLVWASRRRPRFKSAALDTLRTVKSLFNDLLDVRKTQDESS